MVQYFVHSSSIFFMALASRGLHSFVSFSYPLIPCVLCALKDSLPQPLPPAQYYKFQQPLIPCVLAVLEDPF
jgi:hypothetical protein